ncbi:MULTISPECIES: restriction endonuclease subunit S [Brevibacterium]|uniref:Restriction endonuclease subunit S n=1 Tax=Brevibacterium aurantiacum TaxID=273384 RepID=A0A2A3ZP10_BREAU|nr:MULTISPECIES: restriction endonuclease subunit S [Brevibacterium]MDN5587368.1 restriction endonuclease subunit S [Brevibacterium sp.]AZT92404.1 restriction endonuclease subunit S [Brevibacterium aurantiacum]MDN5634568.1 restriction endonuclease subunit S [Brevibacterium sp.]MDN5656422.1 restriction endonuclease subunit S [Brevibacterium sandarakinum]PCC53288.1 hypothetical protein CIK59_11215 [Brevibacterium aurantiacum]
MKMAPLGDVAEFASGGTPDRKNESFYQGEIPWITGADIDDEGHVRARHHITEHAVQKSATKITRKNSLLLVTRTSVGKTLIPPHPVSFSQDLTAISPCDNLDLKYLSRFLQSRSQYFEQHSRGATIKGVTRQVVEDLRIPLPPLDEQRRIAAILDKADAISQKRRQATAHLETLTQSIFHEMFGAPGEWTSRWNSATVGDLAFRITDGAHHTPKRQSSGVPLLSARNIRNGWIDFDNTDFVGQEEYDRLKKRVDPERGDILLSCSGTIGRVATITVPVSIALVRSVALIRPLDSVNTTFLAALLSSYTLQREMHRQANSSAQANLFQNQISRLPAFIPPENLQASFAHQTSRLVDARIKLTNLKEQSDALFTSLQSRAFRGEL